MLVVPHQSGITRGILERFMLTFMIIPIIYLLVLEIMILISTHLLLVFGDLHAYFNFSVEVSANVSAIFYVQIDVENLHDNFGQTLNPEIILPHLV